MIYTVRSCTNANDANNRACNKYDSVMHTSINIAMIVIFGYVMCVNVKIVRHGNLAVLQC